MAFQHQWKKETTVVLINYGTDAVQATVPRLAAGRSFKSVYPTGAEGTRANASCIAEVTLAPQSVRVLVRR